MERVVAALDAAQALTYTFPLAICLETAALQVRSDTDAGATLVRRLLAAADAIRDRGDRPAPPSLREAVERARAAVADADVDASPPLAPRQAAGLARQALTGAMATR